MPPPLKEIIAQEPVLWEAAATGTITDRTYKCGIFELLTEYNKDSDCVGNRRKNLPDASGDLVHSQGDWRSGRCYGEDGSEGEIIAPSANVSRDIDYDNLDGTDSSLMDRLEDMSLSSFDGDESPWLPPSSPSRNIKPPDGGKDELEKDIYIPGKKYTERSKNIISEGENPCKKFKKALPHEYNGNKLFAETETHSHRTEKTYVKTPAKGKGVHSSIENRNKYMFVGTKRIVKNTGRQEKRRKKTLKLPKETAEDEKSSTAKKRHEKRSPDRKLENKNSNNKFRLRTKMSPTKKIKFKEREKTERRIRELSRYLKKESSSKQLIRSSSEKKEKMSNSKHKEIQKEFGKQKLNYSIRSHGMKQKQAKAKATEEKSGPTSNQLSSVGPSHAKIFSAGKAPDPGPCIGENSERDEKTYAHIVDSFPFSVCMYEYFCLLFLFLI